MLFDMTGASLCKVPIDSFGALGLRERNDIQKAIAANIEAITPGIRTMVLAEEFGNWDGANRRIDLLCLDEEKNLVVVELKRDKGAHMDLQALRYAAMISAMRFDQAVDAHAKYLKMSCEESEQSIRQFLNADEDEPIALSDTVRIVLASANFSSELTTAVLWLNEQGKMDIRCVQMQPYAIAEKVLLDVQQLIPLPQAQAYTVALREKNVDQERARTATAIRPRVLFNLTIRDAFYPNVTRGRLMLALVREAIRQGVMPETIVEAFTWRQDKLFLSAPGEASESEFRSLYPKRDLKFFFDDSDKFIINGNTYVFASNWGEHTLRGANIVRNLLDDPNDVCWEQTKDLPNEVEYEGYVVRRRENGAIEVERGGRQMTPAIGILRELAAELSVSTKYASGAEINTQNLGVAVMTAINSL
ncbi:hypothetical protein [Achromobacter denitrificans]|uniref:hypothetical protein n=1 Tax=Achromobacter denitrificans TaxID=32002 RepID=UPI0020CFAF2A|nr:hypothetical protein [Achromobacter denitrificans]